VARRVSLPSADDLFRPTADDAAPRDEKAAHAQQAAEQAAADKAAGEARRTSGRVKHDEKMTVYVTSAELLELEQARLTLRARHGVVADRGRLVREAVALALEDLEENGADAAIVRRLNGEG